MNNQLHRLFVYGTLKRHQPNHYVMSGQTFVGEYCTHHPFPMMIIGKWFIPAVIPEPGTGQPIHGELWLVDDAKLAELDIFESTHRPDGYERREVEIVPLATERASQDAPAETLTPERAWIYFKPRERIDLIHSELNGIYNDKRYIEPARRQP